jgi:hypothetical protein
VGTGNGDPEVPELPNVQGYSWATLSLGDVNSETWLSRLGVGRGANNPTPEKLNVKKPEAMLSEQRSRLRGTVKAVKA